MIEKTIAATSRIKTGGMKRSQNSTEGDLDAADPRHAVVQQLRETAVLLKQLSGHLLASKHVLISRLSLSEDVTLSSVPNPLHYETTYDLGFLYPQPLTKLPHYFSPWNDISLNLCRYIQEKTLVQKVMKLPLLEHRRLSTAAEKHLAYTMLAFTCNAYVWADPENYVAKVLPAQLSVPLYRLAEDLGLQPLLTYTAFALFNWTLHQADGPFCIDDNLDCIVSLPHKSEFRWFCVVSILVEKTFAPALMGIHDGMRAAVVNDVPGLQGALSLITHTLSRMKEALSRMHENLSGHGFNHVIRPFLFGFGGDRSLLQDGLVYEGISDQPITKMGQSAAQSCTVQCIDAALGVTHQPDRKKILTSLRSYMRPIHARLIEDIEQQSRIKDFVLNARDDSLTAAYNDALSALQAFRSYHVQIVAKFIVVPAAKAKTKGTTLMPWLKGLRDSTEDSKVPTHAPTPVAPTLTKAE